VEHALQIGFRQAESGKGEERMAGFAWRKRVGTGKEVTDITITVDQGLDSGLLECPFRRQAYPLLPPQLETGKKIAPLGVYPFWRLQPEPIDFFNPFGGDIVKKPHYRLLPREDRY
jgi:hypothetical protein